MSAVPAGLGLADPAGLVARLHRILPAEVRRRAIGAAVMLTPRTVEHPQGARRIDGHRRGRDRVGGNEGSSGRRFRPCRRCDFPGISFGAGRAAGDISVVRSRRSSREKRGEARRNQEEKHRDKMGKTPLFAFHIPQVFLQSVPRRRVAG